MNLPNWFLLGVAEIGTGSGVVNRDGGSMDLITPASKVSEGIDGEPHVCLEGQGIDSSRIHTFKSGQFLLVLFHQLGESGEMVVNNYYACV